MEESNFSQLFKKFLRINGIKQGDIADICGLDRATISYWINKDDPDFYPKVEYLKKISQHYHVSIDDLVGNDKHKIAGSIKANKKPIWVKTNTYEGFCLIDSINRKFVGVDGFTLSFSKAKGENIECRQRAPAEFYQLYGIGKPLKLGSMKELYIQSIMDEKPKTVWVQVLNNEKIVNNWMNGWYELKENYVSKDDINLRYTNYGAHWLAFDNKG